ncbi:unnamed protein product [Durusdinium trenchii]|uniref:FAD-binding PCMH-type domain-containing protein n=1 Tax=Durusdinium trenchii TaxID=1381693 RepID=A0ABP0RXP0_9DINO
MAFLDCDFPEASRKVRLKDGFAPLASYQVASGSKNLQDHPPTCVVRRLRPRLVLKPGTLREALQALELCAKAEVAVLPQGANTSLTGGSVPRNDCPRNQVIINMRRAKKIMPVVGDTPNLALCFAGAGIFQLQTELQKRHRDSHSVLGSMFLNPSVAAGVSYGSGGTQIRKGPAFTDRALFCRVKADGEVELVDTLGLKVKGEKALDFLDSAENLGCRLPASWPKYREELTKVENKVSRFNADTTGVDCNRSEGKAGCLGFLQRHRSPGRKKVDRAPGDDEAGATVELEALYRNSKIEEIFWFRYVQSFIRCHHVFGFSADLYQVFISFVEVADEFDTWHEVAEVTQDHHMLMEFAEYTDGEVDELMSRLEKFQSKHPGTVRFHVCDNAFSASRAMLFRFAVAPAFRTYCIGLGLQGLSIDYALPKTFKEYPTLPEAQYPIQHRLVYSHFGCNVYHEDFVFDNQTNVHDAKMAIKKAVEAVGGKLPAEHGHGTEYKAPMDTQRRWMKAGSTCVRG